MQLFVGLGNPGPQYAGNRHNAGFMALDTLADEYRAPGWSKKFGGLVTEIEVNLPHGEKGATRAKGLEGLQDTVHSPSAPQPLSPSSRAKLLLLKPLTYMNRSGQSVGEALRFYKLTPEQVTVFHDELDLPLGKLRIKTGGGNGGHNGLRDIDAHIGKDYRRVRLGIGHPGHKDAVTGYVLHDFGKDERAALDVLLTALARELPLLASGDDNAVMTKLSLNP